MRWQDFHVATEYLVGVNNPPSTMAIARSLQFRDVTAARYQPRTFSAMQPAHKDLLAAISARVSPHSFSEGAMEMPRVEGLVSTAFSGIVARRRPTPSAGALYAVKVHFAPANVLDVDRCMTLEDHPRAQMRFWNDVGAAPSFAELNEICLGQLLPHCAGVLFLSVQLDVMVRKYGQRGYRFGLIEAGHIAQSVVLAGQLFDVATHLVGGFADVPAADLLDLDPDVEPVVYGMAIGHVQKIGKEQP